MNVNEARYQIIRDFSKQYQLNDAAHRVKHFAEVEKTGLIINEKLDLGIYPSAILLVAYFHDLFAWSRENHHELAANWIMTTDYPLVAQLGRDNKQLVSWACLQHRASYKGEYSCDLSELMSSADRGMPKSKDCLFQRSYEYHRSRGHTHEEAVQNANEHLKDKYGSNGYARYPEMYLKVFGDQLKRIQKEIDQL